MVILAACSMLAFAGIPPASGSAPLRVAAAAADIEASDDMVIAGGIGPGHVRGQEGALRATALVLESGGTRVALISTDVLMTARDLLDPAARKIEAECGIPFDHILIAASHTHHAPSTVRIHAYDRDETFCGRLADAIVDAARKAARGLAEAPPAALLFRLGEESSVGQNSRILLGDGTVYWVGPRDDAVRPTGPFDPELPVIAFRRGDGGLAGLIFNHSTHNIGTREGGKRSPGFYGLAAQDLEEELKTRIVFLGGAFGSTHNLTLGGGEMTFRIKEAVRRALAKAEPRGASPIVARKREIAYRVRTFDEAKEDAAVSAYCKKRLGPGDGTIDVFRKMRAELAAHQGEERKTWIQAVRIGDIAFVAIPGECFTSLGIEIKRRSPFRYTIVVGVANDYIGYIPDAEAFDLGGYQLWTGFHSLVARGTGEAIVEEAIDLLRGLRGREAPVIPPLPRAR
ncbi:MAG: hypothetical protein JXP34_11275 [Planctomycetes bacterium]|nr:hypothetical protein [Planctomycetota bacterium]